MTATLSLRFTRLSPTRHRFEYRRADGSGEAVEMETEGLILHDLLHYAVEREAGLKGSFYGVLAKIGGYEELTVAGGAALGGEIAVTERVVDALREAMADEAADDAPLAVRIAEAFELYGERPPRWLTPVFAAAARERMRRLLAQWEATAEGGTMQLQFPSPLAGEGGREAVG